MNLTAAQEPSNDFALTADEADADLEAWTPEDFDHFTDLGLLRGLDATA